MAINTTSASPSETPALALTDRTSSNKESPLSMIAGGSSTVVKNTPLPEHGRAAATTSPASTPATTAPAALAETEATKQSKEPSADAVPSGTSSANGTEQRGSVHQPGKPLDQRQWRKRIWHHF
jgi:hypothetical protein